MLYKFWDKTSITLDYNYYGNIYADFDPNDRTTEGDGQAWKLPDYNLFDASLRHGFQLGDFDTTVTVRVNNVFNTEYVSDAQDGSSHTATDALVWFGYGRTFSLSAKIKF
jgi:outer membrane receptor protein involved in Fe transport